MAQTAAALVRGRLFYALQIVALAAAIVAFALSFAHALELPGKMRLGEETYRAVQRIYYPGFTIGGLSEPLGALACLVLLLLAPWPSVAFWLSAVALLGFVGTQAVYWLFTHPVNKVWVQDMELHRLGGSFFSARPDSAPRSPAGEGALRWTSLRDRWEYSHVARAVFCAVSVFALIFSLGAGGSG